MASYTILFVVNKLLLMMLVTCGMSHNEANIDPRAKEYLETKDYPPRDFTSEDSLPLDETGNTYPHLQPTGSSIDTTPDADTAVSNPNEDTFSIPEKDPTLSLCRGSFAPSSCGSEETQRLNKRETGRASSQGDISEYNFTPIDISKFGDMIQPEQDEGGGGEGNHNPDFIPHILKIGDINYFDISSVNMTTLELPEDEGFSGITAYSNNCKLEDLVISSNYTLHKNISNCQNLTITLSGGNWTCNQDWHWLKVLREVDYSAATCGDIKMQMPKKIIQVNFEDGKEILEELEIGICPKICKQCITLLDSERKLKRHEVNCQKCNITDRNIPDIPSKTTHIYLEDNQLTSTEHVFNRIEHLVDIKNLDLGCNELDALPHLSEDSFKNLQQLTLQNNSIRKMESEAFRSLVSRKNVKLDIQYNPQMPCDCNAHFVMKLSLEHIRKIKNFIDNPFRCLNKTSNESQLLVLRPECEPVFWDHTELYFPLLLTVLGILNIFFIYLVYDLYMAIRECRTLHTNMRDPKFHIIVKKITKLFTRNREQQELASGTACPGSNNSPVILRSDKRRMTPCPN